MTELYFAKCREGAIVPTKEDENGAYDVYACFDENFMRIKPHTVELIPTGIVSAFSSNYVVILKERSSTGTKNMAQRSGCIDSGYRGEWFVPIANNNDYDIIISKLSEKETKEIVYGKGNDAKCIVYPYTKAITQFLFLPVPKATIKEIDYYEIMKFESKRGTGSMGSSGK